MNKLKIAVVGAGAIGSYYGGLLAHAGQDVHFLMRSDLETVRRQGLLLREDSQTVLLPKVNACAAPSEIGPCDLVLIGLKATSNSALTELIPSLLHGGTMLLTLQNGLGNEELLAERFGAERVLGGLCFICLNRVAPGVVKHYGHGSLSIGEFLGGPTERTGRIAAVFANAGIEVRVVENLAKERWRKLVWNIPFNGLSIAAGKKTVGEILSDAGLERLTRKLMLEVITAAGQFGHAIPLEFIDEQLARSRPMGHYKPSSLIDYIEGRPVEVEAIWGEPLRRAQATGGEFGHLETLYFLLKHLATKN